MKKAINTLLKKLIEVYRQQLLLYKRLRSVTLKEKELIDLGQLAGFSSLLEEEEDIVSQVKALEVKQQKLRKSIAANLPEQKLDMERLSCLTEPQVYISLKCLLLELNDLLEEIREVKRNNVHKLGQALQSDDMNNNSYIC